MAFGWLQLTSNIGSIIGGLFSVMIAPITFMGIPGWRIAFHIVGVISVIVGTLVYLFAKDPHFSGNGKNARNQNPSTLWSEVKELVQEAKSVLKILSFQIIVAQGVTGSFPWSALSFAPMWLELTGFSHDKTAFLIALFVIASSIGGLFGGKIGDILSTRLPNSGRIILAQISSASAIPLAAILLLGLPNNPSTAIPHGLVLIIVGFFISWNAPATNNPIFAEIVPERSRTSVYALDRSFESLLSSFAPPSVGLLAQHVYGYKPIPQGSTASVEILTDRKNAASLARALYTAIGIPMAMCCLIYSFLYGAYPRDRERAQMEALIESEMQQMESVRGQTSESEEIDVHDYDKDVIDVDDEYNVLLYRQLTFANLGD
ncbi:MFS transporter [Senna tora]|uniref:MFS transporter n=1 Tax=Senna tora TaxID=362788 RepID=A0A834T9W8_9FABA|nr:MFS transporter [Senna tora]